MKIAFIGLGNVGAKLAGSLVRNQHEVCVHDLKKSAAESLIAAGAQWAANVPEAIHGCEVIITCLPSPAASRKVLEDSVLPFLEQGQIWAEMSTTDSHEIIALGQQVIDKGGRALDCPVSGGCHRAATGNISIFAGCTRETFELMMPVLKSMGRRILHTGEIGSASVLKVMTNYLATANLVSIAEALTTAKACGMDMNVTYEAFRISSGNSFVHETEGQVILNGSRDINFTMDLVLKDISLFQALADKHDIPLELSPELVRIFKQSIACYGEREFSPNIIKRYEEPTGLKVLGTGFPAEILDDEPEEPGDEVIPDRKRT